MVEFQSEASNWKGLYSTVIPALLAQVCRTWRFVALSTPELWTLVVLDEDSPVDEDPPVPDPGVISEWIARANSFPLSLLYFLSISNISPTHHRILHAHETIVNNITRWRYISISAVHHFSLNPLLDRLVEAQNDFDSLLFLGITVVKEDLSKIRWAVLEKSPNLRRFSLDIEDGTRFSIDMARFKHGRLTRVNLGSAMIPVQTALQILQDCPCLVSIEMDIEEDYEPGAEGNMENTSSVVEHQALKELILTAYNESDLEYLFSRICLPNLTDLELTYDTCAEMGYFCEFLARSSCHIQSLQLYLLSSEEPSPLSYRLLRYPSIANSVEILGFCDIGADDDFHSRLTDEVIDSLTILNPTNVQLPRLRELDVSAELGTDDGFSKIARMLESRFIPPNSEMTQDADGGSGFVVPLETADVYLRVPHLYWTEDFSQLCALQEKGFDLSLDLEWEGGSRERKILKPTLIVDTST